MGLLSYTPMTPQEGDSEMTLLGKILVTLQGGAGGGGGVGTSSTLTGYSAAVGTISASDTILTAFNKLGAVVNNGNVGIGDGTVGAPSLFFTSDSDGTGTGIYRAGANSLAIAANGVNALTFSSTGAATFAGLITANASIALAAAGVISWSGRTILSSPSDGQLRLLNNASNGFGSLLFGGSTNSFNAIGRDAVNGFTLLSAASTTTYNDASTAGSGTVADRYLFGLAAPTLTATNSSVTYTRASSVYIGGAPTASTNVTIGTAYSLFVDAGNSRFDGSVLAHGATAVPAGGTAGAGFLLSTTANLGLFFGSGAPSLSAAQGSLYMRTDGSGTGDRFYVNTNGTTGWTAVTTAA